MSLDGQRRYMPPYITIIAGCENEREEDGGLQICLWRDKKALVVQAPAGIPSAYKSFGLDPEVDKQMEDAFKSRLAKLETLVNSGVTFGESNWAMMVTRENGTCTLQYRRKVLYKVTSPTWAPLIDEEDIFYTKYITAEDREGIWNGREVDVLLGWNNRWRRMVDRQMRGHILLAGLDLTYEVWGHIVNSDGEIVGIMTEPAKGRVIEFCDRSLVYDAIAKVERRGLSYSIGGQTIMISEGKVRLLGITSISPLKRKPEERLWVKKFHWNTLDDLFEELSRRPNENITMRSLQSKPQLITMIPPPDKPLNNAPMMYLMRFLFAHYTATQNHASEKDEVKRRRHRSHRRLEEGILLATQEVLDVTVTSHFTHDASSSRTQEQYRSVTLYSRKLMISSRKDDKAS